VTAIADDVGQRTSATIFGHPRGLLFIGLTELWDRISFHGMQALLVLYMVEQLLLPGHVEHIAGFGALRTIIEFVTGQLSTQALATQIFGLYVGLVYFTPVFGGALGDRVLGRTNTIALGALLMTAGHFCLAFDASFLIALLLLILGAGCLRGNLSPQLGELYAKDDRRRTAAFQTYGATINIGAFIAPIVTGFLGQAYGWHFAFGFAGVGMLIGLVIYLSGRRYLPAERKRAAQVFEPLNSDDKRIIVWLIALMLGTTMFWIAQTQIWNTYNLWVRDHVDLKFGSWTMPVPWLQSLDGLAPFIWLPVFLVVWRRQARRGREPGEFGKMALGCLIFGASTLLLAMATFFPGASGKASLLWAIAFHMGSNIGWLYFSPIATALYSRAAPKPVNATMMGVNSLSVFFGSVISGRLGGLYEKLDPAQFWTLHAAIVCGGAAVILLIGSRMRPLFVAAEHLASRSAVA
jgi:POT family proton-dependent oligopeptide transporter